MSIEEGHNYVESCEDDDIQAFMEELFFVIGFGNGNASCKYGSTGMNKTDKGEDVEDPKVVDFIQFGTEYLEGKQLAEEDVLELMVGD